MIQLEFDKNGYLVPHDLIETSLEQIKFNFVDNIHKKEHRNELFNFFVEYNRHLMDIIKTDYSQWINGSFISKVLKPRDVDIVSFIDYKTIKQNASHLEKMLFPISFEKYKMDAYMVRTYPQNHDKHSYMVSDTLYWLHHFLKTKPNKQNKVFSKGLVKIKFIYGK